MTYIDIVLRNTLLRVVCNLYIVHLFLVALHGGESWLLSRDWNQRRLQPITNVLPMSWATDRTKHAQLHAILHVQTHQIDKHSEWPKPVTDGGDKAKISKIICDARACMHKMWCVGAVSDGVIWWGQEIFLHQQRLSHTHALWPPRPRDLRPSPLHTGAAAVCRCCFLLTF